MPQNNPVPGEIYRHFKNREYQIVAVASHADTMEAYVVYQALYGDYRTYIRSYSDFISPVNKEKYPEVMQEYRFALIGNAAVLPTKEKSQEPQTYVMPEPEEEQQEIPGVAPWFLKFLDADSYEDKYTILSEVEDSIDDRGINQMAASIDVIVEEGPLEQRILELKKCIRTKARFEVGRLR